MNPNTSLLFEISPDDVVAGLQGREDVPVIVRKSRRHEEAPDRQHGADILRMAQQEEGEALAPGDVIA